MRFHCSFAWFASAWFLAAVAVAVAKIYPHLHQVAFRCWQVPCNLLVRPMGKDRQRNFLDLKVLP